MYELLFNIISNTNQFLSSRSMTAVIMMIMNFGMGFLMQDIAPVTSRLFSLGIMKKIVIFAIVFTATRDLITSLVISVIFIFVFDYVLNEKSALCLIPERFRLDKMLKETQGKLMKTPIPLPEEKEQLFHSASDMLKKELGNLIDSYKNNVLETIKPEATSSQAPQPQKKDIQTTTTQPSHDEIIHESFMGSRKFY